MIRLTRSFLPVGARRGTRLQSSDSTLLTVIGRLEARLLNPLVADSEAVLKSLEELCKLEVEIPLSFAKDGVHILAVRREYKAIRALLSQVAVNMHRPDDLATRPEVKASGPLSVSTARRLDPFSQLSSAVVSYTAFYSSTGGLGGLLMWKQLHRAFGHKEYRDNLLEILYLFEHSCKFPSSLLLRPVVGSILEQRWDQTPAFQITLLRMLQKRFNPDYAYRRNFSDDLNILNSVAANAKKVLTTDGVRVIQYELMNTWLLASRAARRLTDSNRLLLAEACLLEALSLLNTCLTSAPMHKAEVLRAHHARTVVAESALDKAEGVVQHNMMLLTSLLESELEETSSVLRINKQMIGNNHASSNGRNLLVTKNVNVQSQRGRAATAAVLTELSALGRHRELVNILHRLFSSANFNFDTPFVSNGIMDNSKIVLERDIIGSPLAEGFTATGFSIPNESVGQLQQLRRNIAHQSVFRKALDERKNNWVQHNREVCEVDWRSGLLADIMRAVKSSQLQQDSFDAVGNVAMKLMAVAASHGISLTDEFRAAWINALEPVTKDAGSKAGTSECSAQASHSILRHQNSRSDHSDEAILSNTTMSGQFTYSIGRSEMVAVTKLAREAENALLKNASFGEHAINDTKTAEPGPVDKQAESIRNMKTFISHVENTVFSDFFVSSFSKSMYAGSAVLSEPVGNFARGALIRVMAINFESARYPSVLKLMCTYLDESLTKDFPVTMWSAVIDACGKYCLDGGCTSEIGRLQQCLDTCSVVQRHPALLRNLQKLYAASNNGPDAVYTLRTMRRAGVSADFDMYHDALIALFKFNFEPEQHEKHAQLFLKPQETASWFLREMRRDGIKIPSSFHGDLMLLFIKNARVWAALDYYRGEHDTFHSNIYKPEYGGSESVFIPHSTANMSHLEEIIGEAILFLKNCIKHRSHRPYIPTEKNNEDHKRKRSTLLYRDPTTIFDRIERIGATSAGSDDVERKTINGEKFLYRVEVPLQGVQALRETLLRRLLILVSESNKYDLARELVTNSISTFGVAPTSRCYEVLLHSLLMKNGTSPKFVAAEDLLSEMMNLGLMVTSPMLDLFGRGYMLRGDVSEALDAVQELSMQHRVMPSPMFLRDLIELSLKRGDAMEANRAVQLIRDMKWDQSAVRLSVAKLHKIFPPKKDVSSSVDKAIESRSMAGALVDAMKMLFSVKSSVENVETKDRGASSNDNDEMTSINSSDFMSGYYYEDGREQRNLLLSSTSIDELFARYHF